MPLWERTKTQAHDGDDSEMSRLTASTESSLSPAVAAEVGEASRRAALRSAVVESLKQCGLPVMRIDKDELRKRVVIPARLRRAMWEAARIKDPNAAAMAGMLAEGNALEEDEESGAPEVPLIVFINSKSGGRQGPVLRGKLLDFVGEEQVVKP